MRGDVVLFTGPVRYHRLPVRAVKWLPDTRRPSCELVPYRSPITLPGYKKGERPANYGKRRSRAKLTAWCVRTRIEQRPTSVAYLFRCRSGLFARRMHTHNCARCGAPFTPRRDRAAKQRFCSRQCGITAAHGSRLVTPWQERFWGFVPEPRPDGCWEWAGQRHRGGYGRLMVTKKPYTVIAAHRASWIVHNGPIPDGMKVCHRCDNRPCVNPAHLFVGTQAENVADMMEKGRWGGTYGTANVLTRHSPEVIAEIRQLAEAGRSYREIGRRFGICHSHVGRIARHEVRRMG